ncbi:TolB amino-terminal domain-containing protein [Cyclobacterium xiamenense]|jgi:TolB-like protein/AraC-like DNA-binding protein|uniref:TolB amino-terminal domain-containing protein n=1 Tax=Cyclobacterium xiamenense TaxID=1297121 RepID=A0A1H6WTC7_9BACT|nr:tetratricopeptide repeat protein [Cyclobacterium xiamenense]SEJ19156.1 TolB amino-terminal domain-containing protein [Cyclobacterium xiamenense]
MNQRSIAVLPFDNLSPDPENEYFSDGMAEEIIYALSKINGLKVIARTSSFAFKGQKEDVRIIGNKLGVATVIEGSIRKSGDRVRIAVQLIRTDNGFQIWSETFDRTLKDIFELQDEISILVADRMRENFGHMEIRDSLVSTKTSNPEAYDLFLKASHHFKRKDLVDVKEALVLFTRATELDPNFTEAYAYIGETYLHHAGFNLISAKEGFQKSREYAQKALAIHPNDMRAHKVMAYVHLFHDWNWEAAIQSYNEAVAAGLSNEIDFITNYYIFIQKDYDLAIAVAKENQSRDPLHIISYWWLGLCYYLSGRFEDALPAFEESLRIEPNFSEALRWKGLVLGYLGRFEEAFETLDRAIALTNGEGLVKLDVMTVKVLSGEIDGVLEELENSHYIDPCDPAALYSLMNRPDEAIHFLQKGLEEKSSMMVSLKYWWVWDNIREDERFQEIYRQMNFQDHKAHRQHPSNQQLVITQSSQMGEEECAHFLQSLREKMTLEEVVTDTNLTLRSLAEQIALHPNKLSWLINMKLGQNFNDFVNSHRLKVFQTKALETKNAHITLLGLAYESGFTSKSVFNEFFKKSTGLTPKAWVKTHRN